jgi:site-specific recombinase XerD
VEEFLKSLFYVGNSAGTRAGKLSALKSFFLFLSYERTIENDPTLGIPSPRLTKRMPQKFTTRQLNSLFSAPDVRTLRGLRDKAILTTIYGAGLRKFEVVGLDQGDISDTGAQITLRVFGKRAKQRVLTLKRRPSSSLRSWMIQRHAMEAADSALFLRLKGPAERLGTRSITDILKKYARVCGMNSAEAFVHKLRSTWASDLYDAGYDVMEIAKLAGWERLDTAQEYIRISERVLKRAGIPDRRWGEIENANGGAGEEL